MQQLGLCWGQVLPAGSPSLRVEQVRLPFPGDPSMKSGNGIPARCVYLEEMAADLDDQDWLDMDNVEQVGTPAWGHLQILFSQNVHMMHIPKPGTKLPLIVLLETAMRFLGYDTEKSVEFGESSPFSWRLQEFAPLQVCVGGKGKKNQRTQSTMSMHTVIFICSCISHSY